MTNKIKSILFVLVAFLAITTFSSCSSSSETAESVQKITDSKTISKDMVDFGYRQLFLFNELSKYKADSQQSMAVINRIDRNAQEFISTHDIYSDLTESEKNKASEFYKKSNRGGR